MAYTTKGFRPMRSQLRLEGGVDGPAVTTQLDGKSGNLQNADPAGGSINITLPLAVDSNGLIFWIGNVGNADGVVSVLGPGTLATLLNGDNVCVSCDGTTWELTNHGRPFPGVDVRVLSGNLILGSQARQFQRIDPGGSNRVITLPSAASNKDRTFYFANFSGLAATLAIGGIVTINQLEAVWIVSDGAAWQHTGVYTIALT